jgi:hypothetical protein
MYGGINEGSQVEYVRHGRSKHTEGLRQNNPDCLIWVHTLSEFPVALSTTHVIQAMISRVSSF